MRKNELEFSYMIKKLVTDILSLAMSSIKYCIAILLPQRNKEEYYLIGSHYGKKRGDNAIALYNYIKSLDKRVYFIDNGMSQLPDTLKRGSLKSYRLYLGSTAVFFSQGLSDILPNLHRNPLIVNMVKNPLRVFIQHGVIATSRKSTNQQHYISEYLQSLDKTMDFIVSSTSFEKDIINKMGINREKIIITGLPRFDYLSQKKTQKEILIYPTHAHNRSYLNKLNEIFTNPGIIKLKDIGYTIKVGIHNMMDGRISIPEGFNVIENAIAPHIRTSCLVITDNSSIFWDFLYKKADVIFYKPDNSYWHYSDDFLKSRMAYSENDLSNQINAFINNNNHISPQYFENYDAKNCERVFKLRTKGKH